MDIVGITHLLINDYVVGNLCHQKRNKASFEGQVFTDQPLKKPRSRP